MTLADLSVRLRDALHTAGRAAVRGATVAANWLAGAVFVAGGVGAGLASYGLLHLLA